MAPTLTRATNNRIGTCPHGLPMGACPICNGMGGGGGVKRDNKPKEMSWNECYAIGQMLKAQKQSRIHTQQMFAAQTLQAHLNNIQTQINALKTALFNASLPKPVVKAAVMVLDSVVMPLVKAVLSLTNTIQTLMSTISKTFEGIKQKFADIMDKLTALFGEAKAFIEKKISDKLKDIKKKIFNLFGIAEAENEEDEEVKKIEEEKRLQEESKTHESVLKNFLNPYEQDNESEEK